MNGGTHSESPVNPIVPAPFASVGRLAAAVCILGLTTTSALAETPRTHQFTNSIVDSGVVRHEVATAPGSTWAISMKASGDAQMFVSTDASFQPHDAVCGGDNTCTITVDSADELYVFVYSASSASYDIVATPTKVTARR